MGASSQSIAAGRAVTVVVDHLSVENIRWIVRKFDHAGGVTNRHVAEFVEWAFNKDTDDERASASCLGGIVRHWHGLTVDQQYDLFTWARQADYRADHGSARVRSALRLAIDNTGVAR